jgi:hypothetical protein
MELAKTAFNEHKKSAISTYIDWDKNRQTAGKAVLIARTCAEHIVKAVVIWRFRNDTFTNKWKGVTTQHNIIEFNATTYHIMKEQGFFTQNHKGSFAIGACIDLLSYLFPVGLDDDLKIIQKKGNEYAHKRVEITLEDMKDVHSRLVNVLNWFFKKDWFSIGIDETDWKGMYIRNQNEDMYSDISHGVARHLKILEKTDDIYSTERLEEAKQKYFKYLEIVCGKVPFDIFFSDKESPVKLNIEDSFVPIPLIAYEELKEEEYWKNCERTEVNEVLLNQSRLAILGNAGVGKSTLLKSIAIAYAFPGRANNIFKNWQVKSRFPVFIRCKDFKNDRSWYSITDIISNIPRIGNFESYSKQFEFLISNELGSDNLVLIVDGLDEIAEDSERQRFIRYLEIFMETYPSSSIVIASREAAFHEYNGSLKLVEYCKAFIVSPLDDFEIKKICKKWYKGMYGDSWEVVSDAGKFAETIIGNEELNSLAENPLLLTSLLLVKHDNEYLPTDILTLYNETIKVLINAWNLEGHGHEQLDLNETEFQLAYVAKHMTFWGSSIIKKEDLIKCLNEARKLINRDIEYSITEFIKRVENRTGLLRMWDNEHYEFTHGSFQDYLAALSVVKNYESHKNIEFLYTEIFGNNIHWQMYGETPIFVVKLLKNDDIKLIEFIISISKSIGENGPPPKFRTPSLYNY